MENFIIKPIGYIQTDFDEKFGIPRQSGRAPSLTARVVFNPEFRDERALREIEGFSHLWLLFDFSLAMVSEEKKDTDSLRKKLIESSERVNNENLFDKMESFLYIIK